jgi:hypothetical protein
MTLPLLLEAILRKLIQCYAQMNVKNCQISQTKILQNEKKMMTCGSESSPITFLIFRTFLNNYYGFEDKTVKKL